MITNENYYVPGKYILFHGSMKKFNQFNLDSFGINGTANGFGIYLTPNKEMAGMYASVQNSNGYIYQVSVNLENSLSETERTISESQLSKIIDLLQESDDILNVYNDVTYYGEAFVKREVMKILNENKNDVDLINELSSNVGNPLGVAKAVYETGKYTHIVAENQLIQKDTVVIVLNPERIQIIKVQELKEIEEEKMEKKNREPVTSIDFTQLELRDLGFAMEGKNENFESLFHDLAHSKSKNYSAYDILNKFTANDCKEILSHLSDEEWVVLDPYADTKDMVEHERFKDSIYSSIDKFKSAEKQLSISDVEINRRMAEQQRQLEKGKIIDNKKTIQTIDLKRWSDPNEEGWTKKIGMANAQEVFEKLEAHLKENNLLPDEYFIFAKNNFHEKDEIPKDTIDVLCNVRYGGSEGIYLHLTLMNDLGMGKHFATGKTLRDDTEAFLLMSRIGAECSLMLNSNGRTIEMSEKPEIDHSLKSDAKSSDEPQLFKAYKLNDKESTTYHIIEQQDNYSLVKRQSGVVNDPTPCLVAHNAKIKNGCISWDSASYFNNLSSALDNFEMGISRNLTKLCDKETLETKEKVKDSFIKKGLIVFDYEKDDKILVQSKLPHISDPQDIAMVFVDKKDVTLDWSKDTIEYFSATNDKSISAQSEIILKLKLVKLNIEQIVDAKENQRPVQILNQSKGRSI